MANLFKGANTHLINVHVIIGAIVAVDIVGEVVIVVGDVTIVDVTLPKLQKNEAIMKMIKRNPKQKKNSPDVVIEVGVEGVETTVVEAEDEAVGVEAADHIIVDVPAVKVQEMSTHHKMKAAVMRTAMKKLKVRDKMVVHVVVEAVAEDLGAIGDGQGALRRKVLVTKERNLKEMTRGEKMAAINLQDVHDIRVIENVNLRVKTTEKSQKYQRRHLRMLRQNRSNLRKYKHKEIARSK